MKKTGRLGAAYFCRHNDGTRNDPRNLLGTIACQLCDCNSEYSSRMGGEDGVKMFLANSSLGVQELCTKLLEGPLSKCSPFQRKLVVIDALDETEYKSREDFVLLKSVSPGFQNSLCSLSAVALKTCYRADWKSTIRVLGFVLETVSNAASIGNMNRTFSDFWKVG